MKAGNCFVRTGCSLVIQKTGPLSCMFQIYELYNCKFWLLRAYRQQVGAFVK
jgi:hypothetical protein